MKILSTPPIQLSLLLRREQFFIKPGGRVYTVVDHVLSIHDKKIQYTLAKSQGIVVAFEHNKVVTVKPKKIILKKPKKIILKKR